MSLVIAGNKLSCSSDNLERQGGYLFEMILKIVDIEAAGLNEKGTVGRWLHLRPRTLDLKECAQGNIHVRRF